jgi:thiosulfate dehydrogenase [quinone] large subunit
MEPTRLDWLWALVRVLLGWTFLWAFLDKLCEAWADWLFMLGLAGIGVGLILGIVMRFTAACAALLLIFMWMASLPIDSNPFVDDHLVYALVVLGIGFTTPGWQYGLGRWWSGTPLVQRYPWLA